MKLIYSRMAIKQLSNLDQSTQNHIKEALERLSTRQRVDLIKLKG
jgi:mRNA-degrading endonuclease RelE of RelBE toxin-antitoxin system